MGIGAPGPERRLGGIDAILRRGAELYPNRVAIDDRLNGISLSYEELRRRSTQLAQALKRQGIKKGDLVPYAFYNEHTAIEVLFACCMLGAVAMPINVRLSPVEAHAYISRYDCRVFLGNAALAGLAPDSISSKILSKTEDARSGVMFYETLLAAESGAPMPPCATWEDPYMMAMTGGTTGLSKAAVWCHGGCMMDTLSVMLHMQVGRNTRFLCLAPTFHAAGLGWGLLPVLWQAGTVTMPPQPSFDPAFVLASINRGLAEYLLIVPAMIDPLYGLWHRNPITSVQSICVTSAPTPVGLRKKLGEMFPEAAIVAGYGMTETFSMTIQSPDEFLSMPNSVGIPSSVTRLRILDEAGREVPRGQPGHIYARTLAMSSGYHEDEANTAKAFVKIKGDTENLDWMATGDIGFLTESGHLTIVDRLKDVIITGGENVGSIEVENVLSELAGLSECAVVGVPDERWGERVVAVLVMKSGGWSGDETISRAKELCKKKLAGYKVPRDFVFMESLPRTSFGKVAKREVVKLVVAQSSVARSA